MSIQDRLSAIVSEHDAARRAAGVRKSGRMSALDAQRSAGDRGAAAIIDSQAAARSALRQGERARHTEASRLARRIASVSAAIDATEDVERIARLELLRETISARRSAYMGATWATQATEEDWQRGGRFAIYARRFNLGFIAWDAEDIAQEAAEILTRVHALKLAEGSDVLPWGDVTATGSRTLPHTVGEGYAALRAAYRRGLGFYGYERRGTVVERTSDNDRGYIVGESATMQALRWRGEDESALRATLTRFEQFDLDEMIADGQLEIDADTLATVERRRAGLATLARRFPLTADGRMLALATLLTEGYTLGEIASDSGLGLTEATLTRWAHELGALVA